MININGKLYYFDIDAIMEWALSSSTNPSMEREINEGYDMDETGEMSVTTKVIRELKTENQQNDTIRYDFIKILMSPFMGEISNINEISDNLSYTLMFNTLINKNFLVEIND